MPMHKRWRPQRDSNPCFGLERATSWASGRWGRSGCGVRSGPPPETTNHNTRPQLDAPPRRPELSHQPLITSAMSARAGRRAHPKMPARRPHSRGHTGRRPMCRARRGTAATDSRGELEPLKKRHQAGEASCAPHQQWFGEGATGGRRPSSTIPHRRVVKVLLYSTPEAKSERTGNQTKHQNRYGSRGSGQPLLLRRVRAAGVAPTLPSGRTAYRGAKTSSPNFWNS